MSGAAASDLDEEFARLQRELEVVEQELNAAEQDTSQKDAAARDGAPEGAETIRSAAPTKSVVLASEAATTVAPLPAWQQHLLERDLQEQSAAAALRTEARAVSQREENEATSANAVVSDNHAQSNAQNVAKNASNAPPQGKWEWNGTRWEWKTSVTQPVAIPVNKGDVHNGGPRGGETLAAPIGPIMKPPAAITRPASKRPAKRMAAGEVWVDETLREWPENDFRIFVGDLAPDAAEHELNDAFGKYKSFNMARIVKDKKSGKCRGYGFVSFARPEDMASALKEMNGKYVGSRPVKLRKSNWQKRNLTSKRKKELKLFRTIAKPEK